MKHDSGICYIYTCNGLWAIGSFSTIWKLIKKNNIACQPSLPVYVSHHRSPCLCFRSEIILWTSSHLPTFFMSVCYFVCLFIFLVPSIYLRGAMFCKVCVCVCVKLICTHKPELQAEKNRAHHNYKNNIAMTGCLVILYPAWRQSVIGIFFLYSWWARFFFTCSPGLVYHEPMSDILHWSPICINIVIPLFTWLGVSLDATRLFQIRKTNLNLLSVLYQWVTLYSNFGYKVYLPCLWEWSNTRVSFILLNIVWNKTYIYLPRPKNILETIAMCPVATSRL